MVNEVLMAYGRIISKKISFNPDMEKLSNDTSRLLFTWTITHLDRDGLIYGNPGILKSIVFPRRSDIDIKDVDKYIREWCEAGLTILYENNNEQYLYFIGFKKKSNKYAL